MNRAKTILTASQIERVKAMAGVKTPITAVARQLDMDRKTLINALIRQGYGEWMEQAFPNLQGYGSGGGHSADEIKRQERCEMRKLKPEQIVVPLKVPESLQAKWLMGRFVA